MPEVGRRDGLSALRAQLVGAITGPLTQIVSLLQAPQRELVYVLSQRGKGAEGQS